MRIRYTSKLRKYDAGIMELGLEYTDKMVIPPNILGFPLTGYCIAECTKIVRILSKLNQIIFDKNCRCILRSLL